MANPKKPTDDLDSLFAEALEAIENIDSSVESIYPSSMPPAPMPTTPQNTDAPDVEIEIEDLILEETPGDVDATIDNSLAYQALLEEKQALEERYQKLATMHKKQRAEFRSQQEILEQQLQSKHAHLQHVIDQRDALFVQSKQHKKDMEKCTQQLTDLEENKERHESQLHRATQLRLQEQEQHKKYGATSTIKDLLSVFDSLHLTLEHAQQTGTEDPSSVIKGLELTVSQLQQTLQNIGVKRIVVSSNTPFNPVEHEAVTQIPSEEVAPNHVVQSFCDAYMLHDRLLRAAKVVVATKPKK